MQFFSHSIFFLICVPYQSVFNFIKAFVSYFICKTITFSVAFMGFQLVNFINCVTETINQGKQFLKSCFPWRTLSLDSIFLYNHWCSVVYSHSCVATSSCLVLLQQSGACTAHYQLPGLCDQVPKLSTQSDSRFCQYKF